MQILKRAKNAELDIIPVTESEENVREEVNRRTAKAGYTTRYGEPIHGSKIQSVCDFSFLPTKINGKIIGDK